MANLGASLQGEDLSDAMEEDGTILLKLPDSDLVRTPEELVKAAGLDPAIWRVGDKAEVKSYLQPMPDGKVIRNWWVKVRLERVPSFLVKPPKYRKIHRAAPRLKPREAEESMIVIPDVHIGYLRSPCGSLKSLHDRRCLDLAVQVIRNKQPDLVAIIGDYLDLAELGRYEKPMGVMDTLQASLCEGHYWLEQIRRAAPDARIVFFEGNHDARLRRIVGPFAPALATVNSHGGKYPVLSLPTLLGFDKIRGIDYVGPYGSHYPLWPDVSASHGEIHGRDAVRKALGKASCHVVFGHTHKAQVERINRWDATGKRGGMWGSTIGLFAHVDGRLPSGSPDGRDDYHQAFLQVERTSKGHPLPTMIHIEDGHCFHEGKEYVGVDCVKGLTAAHPTFRFEVG